MARVIDVAYFFLASAPSEDQLTHLKLQKLCAYAQAICLAYSGHEMFGEDLEAWQHGPVIPSLYQEFKSFGHAPIAAPVSLEAITRSFNEVESYVLQMVWAVYGRFTAWSLRQQSHWDFPGDFDSRGAIISKDNIKSAFANNTLVQKMREQQSLEAAARELEV